MIVAEGVSWNVQHSFKSWLQWGRNMIVAEGIQPCKCLAVMGASMGPQHDSCGRLSAMVTCGGGSGLQWGRNMIVAEGTYTKEAQKWAAALQWGRNMIVAEGDKKLLDEAIEKLLQWGRNMIVAEGSRGQTLGLYSAFASMGPQHDSCGRDGRQPTIYAPPNGFNGAAT